MKRLIFITILAVLAPVLVAGCGSTDSATTTTKKHTAKKHTVPKLHLTGSQLIAINGMDAAAGKALQATMADGGLWEGKTSDQWCGLVGELNYDLTTGAHPNWSVDRTANLMRRLSASSDTYKTAFDFCLK